MNEFVPRLNRVKPFKIKPEHRQPKVRKEYLNGPSRRKMRNMVRWMNMKETGHFSGR